MSFSEWTEVKLEEIGIVVTGKTPSSKTPDHFGDLIPFVTPTDFKNYHKRIYSAERYLSQKGKEGLKGKVLPPNSVVVTCIGSDMGKVALSSVECVTNQQINSIIPYEGKVDINFLFYKIFSIYEYLKQLARGGTTMPIINKGTFEKINIQLPSFSEQKAIADTLSCLDDKIELNNRINKNLEEMAQAIFKSWFVDYEPFQDGEFEDSELGRIPKGWRVGTLGDILNLNYGKALTTKNRIDGKIRVYSSAGITGFHNKALINAPSIIVGRKGTIGTVYYSTEPSFCIDTAYYASQKDCRFPLLLMYQLLKELNLNRYNEDSAVPGLNRNTVYAINIIIPPEFILRQCNETLTSIYSLIFYNLYQTKTLTTIRDSLLPKLMSGEIQIPLEEVQ